MNYVLIIISQICIMFLYILVGHLLCRSGKLSEAGSRDLATMLIWVILPAVIINSFCKDMTAERLKSLLISAVLSVAALLLSMAVSRLLFKKDPIEQFGAAFSNAGFFGVPLVTAALGPDYVFYVAPFFAALNLLQWTYGVGILTGRRGKLSLKGLLHNPLLVGTVVGVLIFLYGRGGSIPAVIRTPIQGIAAMNAPMAMIILGVYSCRVDFLKMFRNARLYWLSVVRLLIIPMLTLVLFRLAGINREIAISILLVAAAPIGSNVAVYAQLYDKDYSYACETIVVSTLLSVVFLPLVVVAAGAVM